MKKLSFLFTAMTCVGFVSCSPDSSVSTELVKSKATVESRVETNHRIRPTQSYRTKRNVSKQDTVRSRAAASRSKEQVSGKKVFWIANPESPNRTGKIDRLDPSTSQFSKDGNDGELNE